MKRSSIFYGTGRKGEFKHETEFYHSVLFVVSVAFIFLCAASLGGIRLYGLYLEHRIAEVSKKIAVHREENTSLSREYAQLLSPARVYEYANRNLEMARDDNVKMVKIDVRSVKAPSASSDTEHAARAQHNVNPFIERAHANE